MSRQGFGLAFAGLIASIGIGALVIELVTGLADGLAEHHSLGEALYRHFRFFTILTNWGIVLLLLATVRRGMRRQSPPHPGFYGAALIYIVVVCVTYEVLLRRFATPHGLNFLADLALHDIVPAFYLAFWLGFAPKCGLGWRDAVLWLGPPLAYLAMTLVAGALGEGYPYFFLDVATLGYGGVVTNALLFLLAFLMLGLGTMLLSRALLPRAVPARRVRDDRSAAA